MWNRTRRDMIVEIEKLPVLDVHSHLEPDHLHARSLSEVLLYHMVRHPLKSVGWQAPERAADADGQVIREALRYWSRVSNTAFFGYLHEMLSDLYGFRVPLNEENLPILEDQFRKLSTPERAMALFQQMRVPRSISMGTPVDTEHPLLVPARECSAYPFVESDDLPGTMVEQVRSAGGADAVESLRLWARKALAKHDPSALVTMGAWTSSWADYRRPTEDEIRDLFDQPSTHRFSREQLMAIGSARLHALLDEFSRRGGRHWQIIYGCQKLGDHHLARTSDAMPSSLACLAIEHPEIHFNILSGSDNKLQELNTLALSLENVTLSGAWWHNFYPDILRRHWRLRLEMVPAAKLCAYFSDGYCVDWCYGRLTATKNVIADVLTDMVEEDVYTMSQAVNVARWLFFDTPNHLYFDGDL